jgi:hypothetical protein
MTTYSFIGDQSFRGISTSTLRVEVNMKAAGPSQLLVKFYEIARFQNPNDHNLYM